MPVVRGQLLYVYDRAVGDPTDTVQPSATLALEICRTFRLTPQEREGAQSNGTSGSHERIDAK